MRLYEQSVNELTGEITLGALLPPLRIGVKTWLNYHTFEHVYELNTEPSATVPDQSMSVREILDRHSRGLGFAGARVDMYEYDESGQQVMEIPDMRSLDLEERVQYRLAVAQRVKEIQQKLNEQEADSKKAALPPESQNKDVYSSDKGKPLPDEKKPADEAKKN